MKRKLDPTFATEGPRLLLVDDNFLGHFFFFAVPAHCFDISFPFIHVTTEAGAEEARVILTDGNRNPSLFQIRIWHQTKQVHCSVTDLYLKL